MDGRNPVGRKRYAVEREVAFNAAEFSFLRRAIQRQRMAIADDATRAVFEVFTDRIERKIDRAVRNWSQP